MRGGVYHEFNGIITEHRDFGQQMVVFGGVKLSFITNPDH